MQVVLPDGTAKELPDGASGADLAASIGAGPRPRRARREGRRRGEGPHTAAARRRPGRDRHQPRPRVARADPPRHARTCSRPRSSTSTRARRSRSGRRSTTASTTTSSSPRASRSPTTTSSASRPRCASTSRPTSTSSARTSPPRQALERFEGEHQDYKVELIEDLVKNTGVETVSLYTNGPFTDLCRGPHAPSTKRIKAFKLLSVAGAYWRGDSDRQMLTRIYGTAFHTQGGPRAAPAPARGGARARPPQARQGTRPVPVLRAQPGLAVLAAERDGALERADRRCGAAENGARGYREVKTPILYDVGALQDVRPLGRVPGEHVLHGGGGPARWA